MGMAQENSLWYFARFEDSEHWSGGFATRDEAVQAGRDDFDDGDGFYICQASNPPVLLSGWIDVERMLENANENILESDRCSGEFDDDAIFDIKPDQEPDLRTAIMKTCDDWQLRHGLVFKVRTFETMDIHEAIPPLDSAAND